MTDNLRNDSPGDAVLHALARKAGATGHFILESVEERMEEYGGTGNYALEIWTEFRVRDFGTMSHETVYRLSGPLKKHERDVVKETTTIPVSSNW